MFVKHRCKLLIVLVIFLVDISPAVIHVKPDSTSASPALSDSLNLVPGKRAHSPSPHRRIHVPCIFCTDLSALEPVVAVLLVVHENHETHIPHVIRGAFRFRKRRSARSIIGDGQGTNAVR